MLQTSSPVRPALAVVEALMGERAPHEVRAADRAVELAQ
jgi:hypothetical protein